MPDGQLEQAWAATEARTYGASLAGPAPGGALPGLGSAVPFLADAVSCGVSSGTVSLVGGRFRSERAVERKALWREVADGLQLVWRVPILRAATMAVAAGLCLMLPGLRQAEPPAARAGLSG
ncbi:MAG: hypothetical protein ACLQDY_28670 [Streptosporangiaceae bacterium]